MSLKAKWSLINPTTKLKQRSSHSLTVVNNSAYIIAGELLPRTPVEIDLSVLNLEDNSIKTIPSPLSNSTNSTSSSIQWPVPRVGSSLVSNKLTNELYLWGGRGGKSMSVFSDEEDLWKFNVAKQEWESLITNGDKPEQRSFHVMLIKDNTLYLHAGCPTKGRLNTLHSLNLSTLTWKELASAPGPGRGGTVLTSLPTTDGTNLLARFGGFAGFELGGPLDLYNIETNEWKSEEIKLEDSNPSNLPDKRSVHSLIGLEGKLNWNGKKVLAVMALGEREDAGEAGHDGAGCFHSDVFALLSSPSTGTTNSIFEQLSWIKLENSKESTSVPEARGWFPSSLWKDNKVVIQGGLNEKNERLSDAWVLEVVIE